MLPGGVLEFVGSNSSGKCSKSPFKITLKRIRCRHALSVRDALWGLKEGCTVVCSFFLFAWLIVCFFFFFRDRRVWSAIFMCKPAHTRVGPRSKLTCGMCPNVVVAQITASAHIKSEFQAPLGDPHLASITSKNHPFLLKSSILADFSEFLSVLAVKCGCPKGPWNSI